MNTFSFQSMPDFLKSKGVADISAETADRQAALFNEYNGAYKAAVNDFAVGAAKEEVAKAVKAYSENIEGQFETLATAVKTQGLAIQKMTDSAKAPAETTEPVIKELFASEAKLKAIKNGDRNAKVEIKAAGNMSLAGNVTGQIPQAFRLPGYNDVPQREVRFLQLLQMGQIGSNIVEWVYMANEDGTAGATAEGATKKQIDWDWLLGTERVEKYTAFIKVTTEMVADIPFMDNAIRTELSRKLLQSVELGAFSGSGTTPNLHGVYTVATAWAAGAFALAVDNANLVDVLRVGVNQIALALQPTPNYILLHPTDLLALKMIKVSATDKRYIDVLQEIAMNSTMDGIPIITTTLVTQGTFLIGNRSLQFMLQKEAVRVEIGYDGNDFTTNFVTVRAEWRGVVYVMTNDRTAFVKGTIATAIAALETA
jgi:hypothetical protein